MILIRNKIIALALCGVCLSGPAFAQTPIKIGYLNTMSGPLGLLGQDQFDGFMLAMDQMSGKLGGFPVQILKEDDQFKPDVAIQAVQKLIEKENVQIITGVAGSNIMMAVVKPVTDKEVFLVGQNAGPSPLAGAGCSPYLFVTAFQNDSYAEAAGKFAQDKGYKRMMLLGANYQAGKDALHGFKKYFKGEVIDEIYPGLTQPDFSAEMSQIAAAKPDAVFAFFPNAAVNFIRQYEQSGLIKTIPLVTSGTVDGTTLPAQKDSALGVYSSHLWAPDTDNPVSRQFVEAFEKKYNRIPSNMAAQGYDTALLLDAAIGRVKGNLTNKKAFQAALKEGSDKSVRGKLKFNNNQFPINTWYTFQVVKDTKGRVNLKTIATTLADYQDSYHDKCAMK